MDEAWRSELAEFIAIPSVSADPAHREDVKRAGEWVCDVIRRIGGTAELTPFGEKELALGEIRASSGADVAPTVLCYGHFDVQPPAPLELWNTDPFELTIRDEWAYGRGITDDKGQVWILLKAAQRLAEAGALPVNLRFACDGEEEIGGHTIVDYLAVDDRGADAAIIFDGGMLELDKPAFDLATRGLVGFDVTVDTGDRDLHSGMYGGAAMNAIHVLMRCLSAVLAGPDGRLPEPLRAGIVPPTADELAQWATLRPGADEIGLQGATPLDAKAAEEFYVRTWAESSADVNGILGGKPGLRNTTLSVHAAGEFTVRLAPGQDVETIGAAAEQLVRDAAPPGAKVGVKWAGAPPGRVDPDAPAIRLGLDAFEKAIGVRPLLVRSGGTLPIMPALEQKGIPTILTGFGLPESDVHSPNEKFLVRYFDAGIDAAAELYTAFGDLPT
ncbi:MAG TPA: M20/M25/M40 family metallo-hydrolase [Gaiellaceae bacterium]|nr:M20/M25/M40 family metallo-hydrolase [Gaiellaceae bacterium]